MEKQQVMNNSWREENQRGNALSSGYLSLLATEQKTKARQVSKIWGKAKICRGGKIGMKPKESSALLGKERLKAGQELSTPWPLHEILTPIQGAAGS